MGKEVLSQWASSLASLVSACSGSVKSHSGPRPYSEKGVTEEVAAVLAAGLAEAVRSRHSLEQTKRAITAAVGTAAVDTFVSNG